MYPPGHHLQSALAKSFRMRFAYIIGRFPTVSETFITNELRELTKLGADVRVYALVHGRPAVVHEEADELRRHVRYRSLFSLRTLRANLHFCRRNAHLYISTAAEAMFGCARNLRYLMGAIYTFPKAVLFAWEVQRDNIEHVHAHFAHHPGLAAMIIHRLTQVPFSFTVHGHDLHINPQMLPQKVAAATFVATVSEYNKELLVSLCGEQARDKCHVVHCGIDPDRFQPTPENRPGRRAPRIACVGSLLEVKGHEFLIAACALLHRQGRDFECLIVGEGPLRSQLAALAHAAGLQTKVRLLGAMKQADVARILASSDMAVQPSIWAHDGSREGIPVALMESMAVGLPVIASRLSGIPELVESEVTGLLVEPRDVQGLANAILRLIEDPELCRILGNAGRAKVLRDFSLRDNAAMMYRLIGGGIHANQDAAMAAD